MALSKIKEKIKKESTWWKAFIVLLAVFTLPILPIFILSTIHPYLGIGYAALVSLETKSFLGFNAYYNFLSSILFGLPIADIAAFFIGITLLIFGVAALIYFPYVFLRSIFDKEYAEKEDIEPITEAKISHIKFSDVVGMEETKRRLLKAGQEIKSQATTGKNNRNGILMFGPAGTGKSMFAQALAGELGLKIMHFNFSQANSMWVGQSTERVTKVFNKAMKLAPIVLFLDEVDAVLVDRSKITQADGETARLTSALLPLIEDARKKGVVLVAATNLLDSLDPAAIREGRFDYKIEVGYPDFEARKAIITNALRKHKITANTETVERVAARWENYPIPRLQGVVSEMEDAGVKTADYRDFTSAMRKLQGQKGENKGTGPKLESLTMNESQAKTLNALAWRMKNVDELESLGGTLPTGVLFYGPPGTGKTFTARALANSADWAFLSTSGHDLMMDTSKIDKIIKQANDIRPCIVFIDEADDVFGHRTGGFSSSVTNKLLSVMDGANGKNPDIVFIAATNHPDNFDPAALRGGRFTEKVEFEMPNEKAINEWLDVWISKKPKLSIDNSISRNDLVEVLLGYSIANISAILQQAANNAIAEGRTVIEKSDLIKSITTLEGNS